MIDREQELIKKANNLLIEQLIVEFEIEDCSSDKERKRHELKHLIVTEKLIHAEYNLKEYRILKSLALK